MNTKEKTPTRGKVAQKPKKPAPRRSRKPSPKRPTEDVVYTQPGPFNRNRFLLQLASLVAVVLALLFGMSIFFKVDTVTVSGVSKYTEWDVFQASGVQKGENLLTIGKAKICSNIRSRLPYVDTVRIGIRLPGTVKIEITELDVFYAIEAENGSWWLMRSDGGLLEQITAAEAGSHTKVLGVKIADGAVGEKARAWIPASEETLENGEPVPPTTDTSRQLNVAISILQYLEDNGIVGVVTQVDVTELGNLQLWYADRFQVILGDETQLSYKLKLIKTAVNNYMQTYDSGVLDVSLTVQPDPDKNYQVIYTPFPEEG